MNFDELNSMLDAEEPVKANPSAWLISLTDLISLILSFFVLMYSTKDIPAEKYAEIKDSFSKYINGEKPEKEYKFVKRFTAETKIIKKASSMNYVETLLKNSLKNNDALGIKLKVADNTITLAMSEDYNNLNDLSGKINEKVSVLSKTLNPISNQIEVMTKAGGIKASMAANEMISQKLEEFGYEHIIFRTLPDKNFTENIENNKANINIIINSYESVF